MADSNFLAEFIKEPVYVIQEAQSVQEDSKVITEPAKEATVVAEPEVKLSTPTPLPTKGENLKHCIILVNTDAEVIGASDEAFLYKILGAVKRQPNDVLIANVNKVNNDSLAAFLAEHNHKHLLAFGPNQLSNDVDATLYEPTKISGKSYLLTEDLGIIAQNQDKKKALWKALQTMFL